jgi:hypothetical protein
VQDIHNEYILLHITPDHNGIAVYSNLNLLGDFTSHGSIDLYATGGNNLVTIDDSASTSQGYRYVISTDDAGDPELVLGPVVNGVIQPQYLFTLHGFSAATPLGLFTASASGVSNSVSVYSHALDAHPDITLNGIQNWSVDGGASSTTLDVNDSGDSSGALYQVTSNQISFADRAQTVVNFSHVSQLSLSTAAKQSIVQVNSNSAGTSTTIYGNAANGLYNVGPLLSAGFSAIQGRVYVDCTTPGDVALEDNPNYPGSGTLPYIITSTQVTSGESTGVLQYSGARSLSIFDNTGANVQDAYYVESTSVPTYLHGSGSADSFYIGNGDLSVLKGGVTAFGTGSGVSSVVLNDSTGLAPNPVAVNFGTFAGSNTITRANFGGLTFSRVNSVNVNGASMIDNAVIVGNGNLSNLGTITDKSGANTNFMSFRDQVANVSLSITATGGPLALTLDDHNASSFSGSYDIEPGSLNRGGFAGLTFNSLSSLTLDGAGTVSGNFYEVDAGGSASATLPPVTINSSGGNNTVYLGSGDLGILAASVTVNANSTGNYILLADELSNFAGTYTVTSTSVTRPGFGGLNYTNAGLNLIGSAGTDVYNITSDSGNVYIDGGVRGNTFNIGNGLVTGLQDTVSIYGTGGGNAVVLDDSNSGQNNAYTITSASVSKNSFTILTYQGVQSLTVNGANYGGATYTVTGTSVPTTVNGGNNNSAFNVANGDLENLAAALTVESNGSHSSLDVNDTMTTAGQTYTITPATILRPGAATITYLGSYVRAELDAGNHGNAIDVQGTAAGYTLIEPGSAGDNLNVTNAAHSLDGIGAVLVQDAFGVSTATVDDSGHALSDNYAVTDQSISVGRSGMFLLGYIVGRSGSGPLGIAQLNLVVSSSTGNAVSVASTSVSTTINSAAGSSILLGSGDLGTLAKPVTIYSGNTSDSVLLDDHISAFQGTYLLTPGGVNRAGFGGLSYSGVNNLTAVGSSPTDVYSLTGAVTNTHLHLGNGILSSSNYRASNSAVSDGMLVVNGSLTDSGGLSVASGAALAGTGTVVGPVSVSGVLAPGTPGGSGHLGTGNLNLASGSSFIVGQNGSSDTQANVTGTVNLGGAALSLPSNLTAGASGQVMLINNDGSDPVVGAFAGLPEGASVTMGGQMLTISYKGGDGNDVLLTSTSAPAPTVAGIQVNDGSAQRSEVRSITVTFSGPVTFAGGNAAAAFQLTHLTDSSTVNLSDIVSTNSRGQTVVTLTFAGPETDAVSAQNGGVASLADGRYQLTILSANVTGSSGAALVGGGPNGNYVSPSDTYGGTGLHLYRLFGDVNGDGVVDPSDLNLFRSAFITNSSQASYISYLDADNSGAIDPTDLNQFRTRFNQNVFG